MSINAIYVEWIALGSAVAMLLGFVFRRMDSERRDEGLGKDPHVPKDAGFRRGRGLQRVVDGAGLEISVWLLLLFLIMIGLLVGLALLERFEKQTWMVLLTTIGIPAISWGLIEAVSSFRATRFEEKLIRVVDMLIGSLRAGDTPRKALTTVATRSEQPVRREFGFLIRRIDFGMSIHRAFNVMVKKYDSEGLRLFSSAVAAKVTLGGDMIPMLESLSHVLRDRHRHRLRVKSQLAGAKISSGLIALSPYLILIFFYFQKREWIDRLFTNPIGPPVFAVAIVFQIIGFLWLFRMLRVQL